jgi:hypothetical protein
VCLLSLQYIRWIPREVTQRRILYARREAGAVRSKIKRTTASGDTKPCTSVDTYLVPFLTLQLSTSSYSRCLLIPFNYKQFSLFTLFSLLPKLLIFFSYIQIDENPLWAFHFLSYLILFLLVIFYIFCFICPFVFSPKFCQRSFLIRFDIYIYRNKHLI